MNSVFLAFKSNKSDSSRSKVNSGGGVGSVLGISSSNNKKHNQEFNSYENLRHIREIGSSSNMSTFCDDEEMNGGVTTAKTTSLGKRCPTPIQPISTTFTLVDDDDDDCNMEGGHDVVDYASNMADKTTAQMILEDQMKYNLQKDSSSQHHQYPPSCPAAPPSPVAFPERKNNCCLSSNNKTEAAKITPMTTTNNQISNVIATSRYNSSSSDKNHSISNSCNSVNSNRLNRPRLSLSGIGNNNTMPAVHGRGQAANVNGGSTEGGSGNTTGPHKTRLSTHQRNLSLDFRSMGILLPPVSQVTNSRINLTQHHRNRSLDSALQRIPEVEVSSPNAESENTLCTSSILGATMCSKIATSSTNPNNTPTVRTNIGNANTAHLENENEIVSCKDNESKKREDLTSLGSDDSGIICGSEPDQASLTRIRRSRESLDSGEIDPEEECIEIETQSMDEEYRMLQSDLRFYQMLEKDLGCKVAMGDGNGGLDELAFEKMRYREQNICKMKILAEKDDARRQMESDETDESDEDDTPTETITPTASIDENRSIAQHHDEVPIQSTGDVVVIPNATNNKVLAETTSDGTKSSSEHMKNDVIFRGFFGATKNAIFRTAQSIIDNHEKKNSKNKSDDSVKSPTEISKKKEFFMLKSSSSKNKTSSSTAVTPDTATPENETKNLTKSLSSCSLNAKHDKGKVPGGVAQILVPRESLPDANFIKYTSGDKGGSPSGLLRFFESPIFNIHFALHYLFYSKEPGVLSFIGNKIFSFPHHEVDLYMPQLILMYIQMDELAEVLDPYLSYRCRTSVDFSLKCAWLLEAYDYNLDDFYTSNANKKIQLNLMKELYPKKERKIRLNTTNDRDMELLSPFKKTHHRSQSDATGMLFDSRKFASSLTLSTKLYQTPVRVTLGDLTTGRAFDNGCLCFESVRGAVNDLLGHKTVCHCGAPKLAAQKEFMKALIDIGKTLTSLPNKTEKNSRLRVLLNLINKNLPARVWLPLHSEIPHHIVRITEEKTAVLNSKDKTPYIIYVEVVEIDDIFSSPVISKLMPTLRHTKSEEHLDLAKSSTTTTTATTQKTDVAFAPSGASNGAVQIEVRIDKVSESSGSDVGGNGGKCGGDVNEIVGMMTEEDVWSQEDDEITAQYLNLHKLSERDAISQMSLDSCDSREQHHQTLFNIGDVRLRHCANLNHEFTKPFSNDPEDPSAAALKEPWHEKERQIRESSPYGHLSNWRLLSAIVKCGDDLRQELMATQLLHMFKIIWDEENVDLWVRPYKIICLSNDSGLIEPILNTVSLHQIKKNSSKSLKDYFIDEYGSPESDEFKIAQKNFMQSCAAYCLISYLLQVKDRHNGNILLHSDGHLIHIDFGFILNISPKNLGFEQSPFKLTPEFVEIIGGPESELLSEFKYLFLKGLMAARKHMDRVINIVEIMRSSSQLPCFKNGCSGTISNLRKRFHMNLTEQELERKVDQLVFDSLNSLSTKLYDGYQYLTNGIL